MDLATAKHTKAPAHWGGGNSNQCVGRAKIWAVAGQCHRKAKHESESTAGRRVHVVFVRTANTTNSGRIYNGVHVYQSYPSSNVLQGS